MLYHCDLGYSRSVFLHEAVRRSEISDSQRLENTKCHFVKRGMAVLHSMVTAVPAAVTINMEPLPPTVS